MANEWWASRETYSGADRCHSCAGRACLTETAAEQLEHRTEGRLQSFRCPEGRGWHVWSPGIESKELTGRG